MKVDVAIIGAGPAGLTAAIELGQNGVSVAVVDEYFRPGGRLLGQYYENPHAPAEERIWNGKERADELEERARKLGVPIFTGATVWSVSGGWELALTGTEIHTITANVLLLATGSVEKALPLPGWTLPGTINIGAAQTFTNVHGVAIGKKVLIVGVDPLSLSVMMEMKHAGVGVAGMVLPPSSSVTGERHTPLATISRLSDVAGLAPNFLIRKFGKFALENFPHLIARALRFNFLRVDGVPIHLRKRVVKIEGKNQVEAVQVQSIDVHGEPVGELERVEVDAVCLSAGLYPLVDLAQVAGCSLVGIPELGGLVPLHGPDLRTEVDRLFIAGNITGIEGATVAMAQGKLAAISILKYLGKTGSVSIEEAMREVRDARDKSPLRFLPDVEAGRGKMKEIWEKEGFKWMT